MMTSNPDETLDTPLPVERFTWPTAELDPVDKMRALAAGLPHCAVRETVFDAAFDDAWSLITDFANNTARIEGAVLRVEVLERNAESLRLRSRMIPGYWLEADVILRPGWCLMNSRFGQIGMAARAEGEDRMRFIHFEGSHFFGRLLRPYFRWNIGGDFRRIQALLDEERN